MVERHREEAVALSSTVEAQEVRCKQCKQPIPAGARLCVHCKSHQDWRGHLSVSGTILALLVALVSVLTAAVPIVTKALRSPVSNTIASEPIFEGINARVAVSNLGAEPSLIEQAFIVPDVKDVEESAALYERLPVKQILFKLTETSAGFVPQGNAQVIFEARLAEPSLNAAEADAAAEYFSRERARIVHEDWKSLDVASEEGSRKFLERLRPFTFNIAVIESDGNGKFIEHRVDWFQISDILSAHAERCRALREAPSVANGCLGRQEGTARPN